MLYWQALFLVAYKIVVPYPWSPRLLLAITIYALMTQEPCDPITTNSKMQLRSCFPRGSWQWLLKLACRGTSGPAEILIPKHLSNLALEVCVLVRQQSIGIFLSNEQAPFLIRFSCRLVSFSYKWFHISYVASRRSAHLCNINLCLMSLVL